MRLRIRGTYTLLDANVVVALLDKKDSLHEKAVLSESYKQAILAVQGLESRVEVLHPSFDDYR